MNTIDKESMVTTSLSLELYLKQLLYFKLQFQNDHMGSHCIEYFIKKVIEEDLNIYTLGITKDIYPMIAEHYGITYSMTERAIRHSIEIAWEKMNDENKKSVFFVDRGERPTNAEAVYAIYEYVKGYYLSDENTIEEKEQMISSKLSFEKDLKQLIYFKLQFDGRIRGSHYIEYFITKVIKENLDIYSLSVTKDIYPMIAKHYGIKEELVERAIRHSVETAWEKMSDEDKKTIFPTIRETRPTNTEVIYAIYEYIKGHYLFDNENIVDEKEQVESFKLFFEKDLKQLIYFKLQFDGRTNGSHYIEYFITRAIKENLDIYSLSATKDIYPMIAKHYGISKNTIDGSIRYAIEAAWKKMNDEDKKAIFSVVSETRPTNTEAISAIYEYVKRHYLFDNENTVDEKEQLESSGLPFEKSLKQLIYSELQFDARERGSHYIEYFIKRIIKENLDIYAFHSNREIYSVIAKPYGVREESVERAIHYAIEVTWKKISDENKKIIFPAIHRSEPTNMEILYSIYEYFKEYVLLDSTCQQKNITKEKEKMASLPFEKSLKQLIYSELQFEERTRGSHYIEYFIERIIKENLDIYAFHSNREFYSVVAKPYGIREESIERAIRYTIETTWKKISDENKKTIFPAVHKAKPTNVEFLYSLYEYFKEYVLPGNAFQQENITNEKEQIVSSKLPFEKYLKQFIYVKLQFDGRTNGGHYIEYFITKIIQEDLNIYNFSATKSIYPTIAKHYGIKEELVERAIRHSIETAWKKMNDEDKKTIFPVMRGTRPTNTEAIYAIYEYVKGYYPFENVDKQEIDIDGKKQIISSNLLYYYFHFTLQKYLEEVYQIQTKFGIKNMNILIDMLFQMTKRDNIDVDEVITYLNRTYGFVDETISSIYDGYIEVSDALKFLFKICDQINEKDQKEKIQVRNKVYIKKSIDKLLVQAKNIKI